MEMLNLLLNQEGGSGGFGFFGGALGTMTGIYLAFTVMAYLFVIITVSLVLYYFTGSEKKADSFFPKLMAQNFRIFSYVWMFVASIAAFVGTATVLFWMFDNILPDSKGIGASGKDSEWDVLLKGLLVLIFSLVLVGAKILMNRMVVKTSMVGANVSTKVFVTFGMTFFSILFFTSGISFILNFVDYVKESDSGLDPLTWAVFFASLFAFIAYMVKGWMVLKQEK